MESSNSINSHNCKYLETEHEHPLVVFFSFCFCSFAEGSISNVHE